jgi:hypothetical protein
MKFNLDRTQKFGVHTIKLRKDESIFVVQCENRNAVANFVFGENQESTQDYFFFGGGG